MTFSITHKYELSTLIGIRELFCHAFTSKNVDFYKDKSKGANPLNTFFEPYIYDFASHNYR
jgi:hypothetical protein